MRNCFGIKNRDISRYLTHAKLFCKTIFLYVKNGLEFCCQRGDYTFYTFYTFYVLRDKSLVHIGFLHPNYYTSENIISSVRSPNLSSTKCCVFHHVDFFSFAKHSHNIWERTKKYIFRKHQNFHIFTNPRVKSNMPEGTMGCPCFMYLVDME